MSAVEDRPLVIHFDADGDDAQALETAIEKVWGNILPLNVPVKLWVTVEVERPEFARRHYPRGEPRCRTILGRVERELVTYGVLSSLDDIVDERCVKIWGPRDRVRFDITRP